VHLAAGSEQNKNLEKQYKIKIDGETQIFGLIGSNIGYTKSPAMHNRAAQILGINAVYLPLHIDAGKVLDFLDIALHMNFGGFNVTQPHKEIAAKSLPSTKLKSINTIFRTVNGWTAASTDGAGFVAGFKRVGREFSSFENMVFIGAGGAVTAILEFLAADKAEMPSVKVLRRSSSKDSEMKKIVGKKASFIDLSVENLTEELNGKGSETLLVQASSAPLHGDDLSSYVPALNAFGGVVCDLIYSNPSKLYFAALNRDLAALDGEAMLIEQARAAQKIWWGKAASYEEMSAALRGK
jgi:shikimate 5-dehydrogenase